MPGNPKCKHCKESMDTGHERDEHGKTECEQILGRIQKLLEARHVGNNKRHPILPMCKLCMTLLFVKDSQVRHFKKHHKGATQPFPCNDAGCFKGFETESELQSHREECRTDANRKFICGHSECPFRTSELPALYLHRLVLWHVRTPDIPAERNGRDGLFTGPEQTLLIVTNEREEVTPVWCKSLAFFTSSD